MLLNNGSCHLFLFFFIFTFWEEITVSLSARHFENLMEGEEISTCISDSNKVHALFGHGSVPTKTVLLPHPFWENLPVCPSWTWWAVSWGADTCTLACSHAGSRGPGSHSVVAGGWGWWWLGPGGAFHHGHRHDDRPPCSSPAAVVQGQ